MQLGTHPHIQSMTVGDVRWCSRAARPSGLAVSSWAFIRTRRVGDDFFWQVIGSGVGRLPVAFPGDLGMGQNL